MNLKSKRILKDKSEKIKANEIIRKVTFDLNRKIMSMYDITPETILNKSLDPKTGKEFQEIYDFHRISSIKKRQARDNKYAQKIDSYRRKLRNPLNIGEKFLYYLFV